MGHGFQCLFKQNYKKKTWEELVVFYSDAVDSEKRKKNLGEHVLLF